MQMKQLRQFLLMILLLVSADVMTAQQTRALFSISGKVVDAKTGEPVIGAAVNVEDTGIWAISDEKGTFFLPDIRPGDYAVQFSCLGFVDKRLSFVVRKDIPNLTIKLDQNTLALNSVVVTAERDKEGMNTSLKFGANALNHLQMSNVTDISSLLPGGKTVNPDLTTDNAVSLRSGGLAAGNAAFGTALEVDGVRVGNNASFGSMSGTGTRNISTENVQSIEVITGVPSAEYGDLNSGMVRINTRKGLTPVERHFCSESENLSGVRVQRH